MKALVDTHILLWWLADDARLGARHRSLVADGGNVLYFSAVTIAEIAIKSSLGKLTAPDEVDAVAQSQGFRPLSMTPSHAAALRELPWHHRDPFDRMLVAQALVESIPLMTADARLSDYPVQVL